MKLYTEIKHKSNLVCSISKNNNTKCKYKAKFISFQNEPCCGKHLGKCLTTFLKNADTECSICFSSIKAKNAFKLPCDHIFHEDCINKWSNQNNSCPLCRKIIDENKPIEPERRLSIQISVLIAHNNTSSNLEEQQPQLPESETQDDVLLRIYNIQDQLFDLQEIVEPSDLASFENIATINDLVGYLEEFF
jgi:hypothetical protein